MARSPEDFLVALSRLPAGSKFFLLVGIALIAAIGSVAWMWGTTPEYRVLFSNMSDRDGASVVASLGQMNIPYKFAEGGGAILVPSGQVHETRLKLASQGLPKGSLVGFEIMRGKHRAPIRAATLESHTSSFALERQLSGVVIEGQSETAN